MMQVNKDPQATAKFEQNGTHPIGSASNTPGNADYGQDGKSQGEFANRKSRQANKQIKASREIGFNSINDMHNERDEAMNEEKPKSGKASKYQVQKPLTNITSTKLAKKGSDMMVTKGSGKKPHVNVNATPTSQHQNDEVPDERKSMRFSLD